MKSATERSGIREAVGIFNDAESMRLAIKELLAVGLHPEQLGLLASEEVVAKSLDDMYIRRNPEQDAPEAPAIAFVERDSIGEAGTSLGGGLFFIGTSGVMGGVVASSAVFGGALVAAVSGAVAVAVVGALVASIIHQSDAEFLQQQVDEGRILLFARIDGPTRESEIRQILKRHSGRDVKVFEIPVERLEPAVGRS